MDTDGSGDSGFEHKDGSLLDCPSLGIFTSLSSLNGVTSIFTGDYDPPVPLAHNADIIGLPPLKTHDQIDDLYAGNALENQGMSSTIHLTQYSSDPRFVELVPNFPHFSTAGFSEMVTPRCLPKCHNIGCPPDHPLEKNGTRKTSNLQNKTNNCAQMEGCQIADDGTMELSPIEKKRKRLADDRSQFAHLKNMEAAQPKDECLGRQDERKQKAEQKIVANNCGKLIGAEVKMSSQTGEAPKEDYIHVRAKRGQATNSHSLAERVRRERISERMKFLQDLVPGCNKITGKAVMLDEIINYVQSLQRQVEFLSMKLATVYPEMNVQIERILSSDIHHSKGGTAPILGFGPGMNSAYPIPQVTLQAISPAIESSTLQSSPMSPMPNVWDNELQGIKQMGFTSTADLENLETSGCTKVQL
ncbi:unnamed protein product, partial [Vitis vinifera]|uniref:BHLH domain-containing protein n=1 Tax=Vitis vinifera TaxID=29760 RepID=D7UE77_VITVI|eukprot:XP_003634844.1 PREDICTED: transcription factor bHLH74 isoform X1 [Vitis vinifera]